METKKQKKLFICDITGCERVFTTKYSLKRHCLIHINEKPLKCQYCDSRFRLQQYLQDHENTHTFNAPHVCGISGCTASFRQSGKLSTHRATHRDYHRKQYHTSQKLNSSLKNQRAAQTPAQSSLKIVKKNPNREHTPIITLKPNMERSPQNMGPPLKQEPQRIVNKGPSMMSIMAPPSRMSYQQPHHISGMNPMIPRNQPPNQNSMFM